MQNYKSLGTCRKVCPLFCRLSLIFYRTPINFCIFCFSKPQKRTVSINPHNPDNTILNTFYPSSILCLYVVTLSRLFLSPSPRRFPHRDYLILSISTSTIFINFGIRCSIARHLTLPYLSKSMSSRSSFANSSGMSPA